MALEEKLLRDVMAIPKFFEEDLDDDEFWEGEDEKRHCSKGGEVEKPADWEGFMPKTDKPICCCGHGDHKTVTDQCSAIMQKNEFESYRRDSCCEPVEFDEDDMTEIQVLIGLEINYIRGFLLEKNRKYGNSALEPIRVFSKADPIEQLRVRIDDKIKRITTCQADDEEDSILDLIGYLILLRVAKHQE